LDQRMTPTRSGRRSPRVSGESGPRRTEPATTCRRLPLLGAGANPLVCRPVVKRPIVICISASCLFCCYWRTGCRPWQSRRQRSITPDRRSSHFRPRPAPCCRPGCSGPPAASHSRLPSSATVRPPIHPSARPWRYPLSPRCRTGLRHADTWSRCRFAVAMGRPAVPGWKTSDRAAALTTIAPG